MLGEMSGATATCVAAPSTTCKAEDSLRDVAAEREALSLAHRRGKCAPSVDTKLTDAWLGFYVALTKNTPFAGSAATTEAATETSLSEWASSHGGSSPRRAADGETEESSVFNEAAEEDCDEAAEEETPTKRPSKSHRRRRTRGKGKKNSAVAAAARAACEAALQDAGKVCHTLEEEGTRLDAAVGVAPSTPSVAACGLNRLGAIMSTSPSGAPSQVTAPWPFQGPRMNEHCGRAVLPIDPRSPSKPCAGPMGIVSTMPNAGQTPKHREASDRTPPRMRPGFGSPLAQMMPGTPTSFGFGTPTNQAICSTGGHMAYQGGHLLVASPVHDQAGNTFFMTSPGPEYSVPPPTPANTPMAAGYPQHQVPSADSWRSWLAGSPMSGVDLIKQLEAAAPETYED